MPKLIFTTGDLGTPFDCRVWLIDLRGPLDVSAWQACSEDEHRRAARFKFERDAARYRASHAAMRRLLCLELDIAPQRLHFVEGPHGKPALAHAEGLHFNLSHSGDWALLGISRTHRIGVDIECHKPMPDMDAVARQVFNDAEQQGLGACAADERATFFFRTWVCKEACLKAWGSGLSVEPRCVRASWAPHWAPAAITLPDQTCGMTAQGIHLPITDEAVEAAVALCLTDGAALADTQAG